MGMWHWEIGTLNTHVLFSHEKLIKWEMDFILCFCNDFSRISVYLQIVYEKADDYMCIV